MAEYKRFIKEDWYGYAGAEKFTDGTDPFIYHNDMNDGQVLVTIIADTNGIEIYFTSNVDCDDNMYAWAKRFGQPVSSLVGEGELRAFIKEVETFTYAPDLTYCLNHPDREVFFNFFEAM